MSDRSKPSHCTFTGVQFYPLDPDLHDVKIEDIAHSLAYTCRYRGHVKRYYSVAEHSILVAEYMRLRWPDQPELRASALFHDASEAYLTDINGIVKKDPRVAILETTYPARR